MLFAGCFTASAQQQAAEQTVETFNPHWFVQAQVGGQYTLGEVDFSDLLSGNLQAAVGFKFTPVWSLRLSANAWQSKGGSDLNYLNLGKQTWKYNYIAPSLDLLCDLTNWIYGYKADRICNFGLMAGLGANIGWNNGEAYTVRNMIAATPLTPTLTVPMEHQMSLIWSGTQTRFVGRFGAYLDFRVSRRVALGLEVNCNATSDHYNSKDAGNADWYFNALAGIKVCLGKISKKVSTPVPAEPVVVEKPAEKPEVVEKIVYRDAPAPVPSTNAQQVMEEKRETLRRDIFFNIRGSEVSRTEMLKVEDIVAYLVKYPDAKVTITGYADRGTGNAKLNDNYARKRAQIVADLLTKRFNIASSRITVDSKGDTVQPYEQNDLNRVSICIAE